MPATFWLLIFRYAHFPKKDRHKSFFSVDIPVQNRLGIWEAKICKTVIHHRIFIKLLRDGTQSLGGSFSRRKHRVVISTDLSN